MGDAVSQTVARPPTTSSLQKSRTVKNLPRGGGENCPVTVTRAAR